MSTRQKAQKGFSLFELVVVIVIAAILFSLPRLKITYDPQMEAVLMIEHALQHTQYLALIDDKEDTGADYSLQWWRIMFHKDNSGNAHQVLSIWSNKNKTGSLPASDEVAVDPLTGLYMSGNSQFNSKTKTNQLLLYDLTQTYGVEVSLQGEQCTGKSSLYFDHFGRPHSATTTNDRPNHTLLTTSCTLLIKSSKRNQISTITLFPYSGMIVKN